MKFAILGAGNIAEMMANTINQMDEVECYAVASRSLEKAQAFADKFGFEKAYGSYEELVKDDQIDLVYIATPHSHHYAHTMLCINNNKNVLCEKAFTVNAKQAKEVLYLAESKNVFVAEAIWTRYMPMRKIIDDTIASGIIGEITSLSANLGYLIDQKPRILQPELAGGALLDLGIYVLNFASMIFGDDIKDIHAHAIMTDTGVDAQNSITITYPDNKMAVLYTTTHSRTNRKGVINGRDGYIVLDNINNYEKLSVYDTNHKLIKCIDAPKQITGYEYQVLSCIKAMNENKLECPEMTHKEIINMMQVMDTIRKQWNLTYPCE